MNNFTLKSKAFDIDLKSRCGERENCQSLTVDEFLQGIERTSIIVRGTDLDER